jgi:hypothetical protein
MSEFIAGVEEIEHIDKALDLLQKRELSLKREILYLQEEREALLIIRRLATSSIAPVHRLPDEVLGEIFVAGTFGFVNVGTSVVLQLSESVPRQAGRQTTMRPTSLLR